TGYLLCETKGWKSGQGPEVHDIAVMKAEIEKKEGALLGPLLLNLVNYSPFVLTTITGLPL
ncbi:MAG: hypothetical protein ABIM43_05485, partial [candidate division WOR-3 bacterium]